MLLDRRRFLELCISAGTVAALPKGAFAQTLPTVRIIAAAPVIRPDLAYQFLGIPLGYYQRLGFRGDFATIGGSAAAIQLLLSGSGEISSVGFVELIAAKSKQPALPVTCVFMQEAVSSYQVVVLPDSPIKDMKEFAGKSIGVANLASGAIPIAKGMLKTAGVNPESVTMLPVGVGPQALTAIRRRQVDGIAAFVGQLAAMENLGQEFRYFVPPVPAAGFVVANKFLEQQPELVIKALQGIILNQIAMQRNPEMVVRAFWKLNGQPAGDPQALLRDGVSFVRQTARTFKSVSDPAPFGLYTENDWSKLKSFLDGTGMIPAGAPLANYYSDRFIAAANKVDVGILDQAMKDFGG
jgi:NitT/TauT family transport system substrate-binding protein